MGGGPLDSVRKWTVQDRTRSSVGDFKYIKGRKAGKTIENGGGAEMTPGWNRAMALSI